MSKKKVEKKTGPVVREKIFLFVEDEERLDSIEYELTAEADVYDKVQDLINDGVDILDIHIVRGWKVKITPMKINLGLDG